LWSRFLPLYAPVLGAVADRFFSGPSLKKIKSERKLLKLLPAVGDVQNAEIA
jgi:hypothetical protein